VYFIGIDLAWSDRNNTAAAAIKAQHGQGELIHCKERLGTNDEIIAFISEIAKAEPAIVGIDAPLLVPNKSGTRPCDLKVTREFGHYHAGAFPANRKILERVFNGRVRGEELVRELEAMGFTHDYNIAHHPNTCRQVVEVYPHPATINLFKLPQILKYKRRKGRSPEDRRKALSELQQHIISLKEAKPCLQIEGKELLTITSLLGSRLKVREDLLDAILCAHIVYHAWYWGEQGYEVFGDLEEGYILLPKLAA